ncbi:MAG: hypothetical protein B7O98_01285 [Zestosphaera tikiterensis]|uniref:Uncharacterized protein n=1 Tax=Zestosphaera tikiterensis TaxID=1973259 RepID=A0A2R7Y6E2_9CREN|nr:MAG: hypothetical protein B7O98_01285 [Zestosphaera tikiterensis]
MTVKKIKIKNTTITLPPNAELLKQTNLDEVLNQTLKKNEKKSDVALVLKCGEYVLNIVIEDTGTPELRDIRKLEESYDRLIEKNFLQPANAIKMLLLHHKGGVDSLLKSLAMRSKVEVVRCSKSIDLYTLLRKREFCI